MALAGKGAIGRRKRAEILANAKPAPWQAIKCLSRAQRVICFLESLPITKGHLQGTKMKLLPEQKAFIESVYRDDYLVSKAILSTPKGNGKTGLSAGLGLCHLLGPEAIPRGEVYSAAIDRGQAAILFAEMVAIIEEVPELFARTNIVKHFKTIEVLEGPGVKSEYEALSNDSRGAHGWRLRSGFTTSSGW